MIEDKKHAETPHLWQKKWWSLILVGCLMYNQQLYHNWYNSLPDHLENVLKIILLIKILIFNIENTFYKDCKISVGPLVLFSVCIITL